MARAQRGLLQPAGDGSPGPALGSEGTGTSVWHRGLREAGAWALIPFAVRW